MNQSPAARHGRQQGGENFLFKNEILHMLVKAKKSNKAYNIDAIILAFGECDIQHALQQVCDKVKLVKTKAAKNEPLASGLLREVQNKLKLRCCDHEEILESITRALVVCPHDNVRLLAEILRTRGLVLYKRPGSEYRNAALWHFGQAERLDPGRNCEQMFVDCNVPIEKGFYHLVLTFTTFAQCEGMFACDEVYAWDVRLRPRVDEELGDHLVAGETIPANTVIIEEKIFSSVLAQPYLLKVCNECHLRETSLILWPCARCSDVVFCSPECETKSVATGKHRFLCGMHGYFAGQPDALAFETIYLLLKHIQLDKLFAPGLANNAIEVSSVDTFLRLYNYRHGQFNALEMFKYIVSRKAKCTLFNQQYILHHLQEAFFLGLLMMIQKNRDIREMDREQRARFFRYIFDALVHVDMAKFSWFNHTVSTNDKIGEHYVPAAAFLNHRCQPNAAVYFVNNIIHVAAKHQLAPNELVTISFEGKHSIVQLSGRHALNRLFCMCKLCEVEMYFAKGILCCRHCASAVFMLVDDRFDATCLNCGRINWHAVKIFNHLMVHLDKFEHIYHQWLMGTVLDPYELAGVENLFGSIKKYIFRHGHYYQSLLYKMAAIYTNFPGKVRNIKTLGDEMDTILPQTRQPQPSEDEQEFWVRLYGHDAHHHVRELRFWIEIYEICATKRNMEKDTWKQIFDATNRYYCRLLAFLQLLIDDTQAGNKHNITLAELNKLLDKNYIERAKVLQRT